MERVTISLDEDLLGQFDSYLEKRGYSSRSEAIRDLLRDRLEQEKLAEDKAEDAVACLSYVYNHEQRELSRRLARTQHAHHHLVLSTLHVHLDHENCLEVALLKGNTRDVRKLAEATMAETGVRHGNLHIVPDDMTRSHHIDRRVHSNAHSEN
jgi:CopG family nickel-responsive transcriptional regulator